MALGGNSSDKKVVGERQLYTGIVRVKVVAFNPSAPEIKELYQMETDPQTPEYLMKDSAGNDMARLSFYLQPSVEQYAKTSDGDFEEQPVNFIAPLTFFLRNKFAQSTKTGKTMFINKYAQHSWMMDANDTASLPRFLQSTGPFVPAYQGETDLLEFLYNWLNVSPGQPLYLENREALFKGDFSEIKDAFEQFRDNEVQVMLGIRQNQYQDVYDKAFLRPYAQSTQPVVKALNNPYAPFGTPQEPSEYQGTTVLQVYNPDVSNAEPAATSAGAAAPASASGGWGQPAAPAQGDNPFGKAAPAQAPAQPQEQPPAPTPAPDKPWG